MVMGYKFIVFLGIVLVYVVATEAQRELVTGGLQEQQPADDDVKALVGKLDGDIKAQIKAKSCASNVCLNADKLDALFVRTQVVSGTNYYVSIKASEGSKTGYYHVTIYEQPWTNTLEVTDVEGPKGESDPL